LHNLLLQIQNLSVSYATASGPWRAVTDVSFEIARGETLALIGETGCGKSTITLALLGLLGSQGCIESGEIVFEGRPLRHLKEPEWRNIRGSKIGLVFQDSRSAFNPVLTVDRHMMETLRAHRRMPKREARDAALAVLAEVGIPDPAFFMGRYPSELSGGMCQRVAIALAICNRPQLLIADEPTSALDPSIQAQILDLLKDLKRRQGLALLLVSHDLAMVSEFADLVAVMYQGRLLECGHRQDILVRAAHPYTRALIRCLPDMKGRKDRLATIPGAPMGAGRLLPGCGFAPRCNLAEAACSEGSPPTRTLSQTHWASCIKAGESQAD
jgi:oligopeptide/dipeptide ABC transporter ATP-binding protein